MDEDVELATEHLSDFGEDARDVVVRAHIALGDELRVDSFRELTHALLDPFALIRERELRAAGGKLLRNRPRDRALVRDAEDECALACESSGHCERS